jgi:hypothetical protein
VNELFHLPDMTASLFLMYLHMSFITQTPMALEAWLSGNRVLDPGFESRQGVRFYYIAYDTKMAT